MSVFRNNSFILALIVPILLDTSTHDLGNNYVSSQEINSTVKGNVVRAVDNGYILINHSYQINFTPQGLHVNSTTGGINWSWSGKGFASVFPAFDGSKISYDRGNLIEQYIIKEHTIEQQFLVQEPQNHSIVIDGRIESNGSFEETGSGNTWKNEFGQVAMSKVLVFDVSGKSLNVENKVSSSTSHIEIDVSEIDPDQYPILIDPEIATNDFRITTFGVADDVSYSAINSSISYNSSSDVYLVVWEGVVAAEGEIWGQRLDGSGNPIGGDFQISDMGPSGNTAYTAQLPDVASSGSSFLVVWFGDDDTAPLIDNEFEIFGQLVTASSGALSGANFRISDMGPDANTSHSATAPSVVYNNTQNEFLVVWAGDDVDNENEIYGQRITSAGAEAGTNDFRISDMGPDGSTLYTAATPDVAWNSGNNQYMVVWAGDDNTFTVDGEFEIFMQRLVGTTGGETGSDVQVSDVGPDSDVNYRATNPAIASLGSNYLVVWRGEDNTGALVDNENEVFGQLYTNAGAPTGSDDFRISDMGPDGNVSYEAFNPAVASDPNLNFYLVTWHGDDNTGSVIDNEFEIYGQLITSSGTESGTDQRLSDVGGSGSITRNGQRVGIVYNSTEREFLITWDADDLTIDGEFEIFGQRFAELSPEPTTQPTSPIFTSITSSSFTVAFSAASGSPAGYIVLRKSGSSPTDVPTDQQVYAVNDLIGTSTVAFVGSLLTFNQSGLNEGTTYHYDFFSYNGVNSSTNYLTASPLEGNVTTLAIEPSAHAATFTATQAGTNQINLAFSAASTIANTDGYIILRRQDGTNPTASGIADAAVAPATPVAGTTLIATITNTATTSFNDTGVSPGIQYNYVIIPYGYNGSNALSYNFRTAATIPAATATTLSLEPSSHAATFTAVSSGTSQINLSFSAANTITNAAGYIILRRQDGANPTATGITDAAAASGTPTTGTTLVTTITNTAATSFNDAVSAGNEYNYAIIPYGYNGSNALSYNFRTAATIPTANATTLSLEPLAHPAMFTATTGGSNQINLTFSAASTITNAAGYIILRRQDLSNPTNAGIADATATSATPTAGTTLVTTITNTATTSFNDTGVSPGAQYNYAIFAYGYNGSNTLTYNYLLTAGMTANAFTLSLEPASHAASFTASPAGTTQINLTFSAASTITNAAGYIILRRQDGTNPATTGVTDGATTPGTPTAGTTLVTTITNTATTTFNDAVSSGTQYNYSIIPYGYNGSNAQTYNYRTAATVPTANATTLSLEPLAHPPSFTATTGGSNQINLTFSAASTITNAAGYIILRRQDLSNPTNAGIADATATPATPAAGTTLVTSITNTASTSFNDTGVSPGIQYNYTILPYGYNGTNALTYNYLLTTGMSANAFTLSTEPAAHSSIFTATQAGTNQINLAFSAASTITNAAGYIILRRQDGANPTTTGITDGATATGTPTAGTTLITTITNTSTTTFNDAVSVGTQYNYAIIPYGYNGSNAQTYNFRTAATVPVATATTLSLEPTGHAASFTAVQAGTTQINLIFSAASTITNAAGYIILRRSDGSNPTSTGVTDATTTASTPTGGTTLITTITNTATTAFSDTGLDPAQQYNYAIIPYGYNGTNALSYNYFTSGTIPTANATTLPDAPIALDADQINPNSFRAHWQSVPRAVSYEIDVSLSNTFTTSIATYPQNVLNVTEWLVSNLSANTPYHYRVRAYSAAGGASAFSNVKSLQTAPSTGSDISITEPLTFPDFVSTSVTISAAVEFGNGTKTIELFHRKITSEGTYTSISMSLNATTAKYEASVPAAAFDELGLEFYIRAQDLSGTDQTDDLYYCYRAFAENVKEISSIVLHGGKKDTYQLISIPYDLGVNNGIEDIFETVPELGDHDKTKWRLVRYQSNGVDGGEYIDPPTFNKIDLGKSYWFNSVEEVTVTLPAGTTPNYNQSSSFAMQLVPGWNQIATPYPFAIDWNDVLAANPTVTGVNSYKIFNAGELGFIESDDLKPYEGGFVFSQSAVTLTIPVTLKNSFSGGRKAKDDLSKNIDAEEWLLPLTLVQGDIKNCQGGIGMHPNANTSKDQWDDVTMPRFIQYLETNFYHPEFFWPKFSKDIVPTIEEHEWALSIESNGEGSIELQWDAQAITNAQANLFLYDEAEGRLIDMKVTGAFTIPESSRKDLKIIYTHKGEYIPNNTMLGNAWPNPASAVVNIPFVLSGSAPAYAVEVDIYDLKGIKQKSIGVGEYNAGVHTTQWDIQDANGNDVTNGVYIVKLKVNGRYLPDYSKVIVNRNR